MAKLLIRTFLCLLLVIAATALPPLTQAGLTPTSPKFTGTASAHSSTVSTPRPTTTKPLPKDVQEVVDTLNEADESSKKASETLKKILEGGEVATEIAEMFLEDLPIIGGVMKVFGSLFSIFANAIESKMIMKELEEIFDEMQRQFAEVNRRLDMISWQIDEMFRKLSIELFNMELGEQFNKISAIQDAKKRYEGHQDIATLQELRDTCKSSDPASVIRALHDMVIKVHDASQVQYNRTSWNRYSREMGTHFVQAMLLQQVCLGVQIKPSPTVDDREYLANYSSAQFLEVMDGMAAVGKQIEQQWHEAPLVADIQHEAEISYHSSTGDAAKSINSSLTNKYDVEFAVVVYKLSSEKHELHQITNRIFDNQKAKVLSYQDRTIVVIWAQSPPGFCCTQRRRADDAVSKITCTPGGSNISVIPSDAQSYFTAAITGSDYENLFRSIYFVAANSNMDIGMAYDYNKGPAYIIGPKDCGILSPSLFTLKIFAIFGY